MKKRFLHLFSLMLAVLMLIPCVGSAEEADAVDNGVMREGLTALEATRLMGNGINLGNTLEACDNNVGIKTNTPLSYETHWGQPKTTQAMIDGMKAAGQTNIVNLVRCAWAGSQKYGALVWSGDIPSTFGSMKNQLAAGLNMGIAGIPWWANDIGGFYGVDPTNPDYQEHIIRW